MFSLRNKKNNFEIHPLTCIWVNIAVLSYIVYVRDEGSGESVRMRRLVRAIAVRLCLISTKITHSGSYIYVVQMWLLCRRVMYIDMCTIKDLLLQILYMRKV